MPGCNDVALQKYLSPLFTSARRAHTGCVIPTYVKHELQRMRLPPYIAGMEYFKKRSTKKGFGAKKEGQVEAGAGKQKE